MRVCADKVQAYKLTFETMDNCKNKHATLDATSALRLTPTLAGLTGNASPAGKIRAMFTPSDDPDRVPHNILFVDLTERASAEFPELWKLGQAYFKGELHVVGMVSKDSKRAAVNGNGSG